MSNSRVISNEKFSSCKIMPPRRGRPAGRRARLALPETSQVPDPSRGPETLEVPEAASSSWAPPTAPTQPAAPAEIHHRPSRRLGRCMSDTPPTEFRCHPHHHRQQCRLLRPCHLHSTDSHADSYGRVTFSCTRSAPSCWSFHYFRT